MRSPGSATGARCSTTSGAALRRSERPAARALRPRRLQGLQRQLRPSGRRRAARAGSAQKLAAAVRPHGRAYRLGGDEFCVLASLDADDGRRRCSRRPRGAVRGGRGVHDRQLARRGAASRRGRSARTTPCGSSTGGCTRRRARRTGSAERQTRERAAAHPARARARPRRAHRERRRAWRRGSPAASA